MNPNLIAMAFKIADSAARSDIECFCTQVGTDGKPGQPGHRHWYDSTTVDDLYPPAEMQEVIWYLEQRSILIRHPVNKAFVSFKHDEAIQAAA